MGALFSAAFPRDIETCSSEFNKRHFRSAICVLVLLALMFLRKRTREDWWFALVIEGLLNLELL